MFRSLRWFLPLLLTGGCQAPLIGASQPAATLLPTALDEHVDFHQGLIQATQVPTNLAIQGTGFFVLSKSMTPKSLDDLVFTRDGSFSPSFVPTAERQGYFTLVNPDGYQVLGYTGTVIDNVRPFGTPPTEAHGTDITAFAAQQIPADGSGLPATLALAGFSVPEAQNLDAANSLSLTSMGMLEGNGQPLYDAQGMLDRLSCITAC